MMLRTEKISNRRTRVALLGRMSRPIKSQDVYSDEQLRLAAHLYYAVGIEQKRLAQLLNVSQAKISRMLAVARERKIARFVVEDYEPRDREIETRLMQKFPQISATVIRTPEGMSVENKRQVLAHFASPFVTSLISPHSSVVVAGGRTIGELVHRLPEERGRRGTIVQALGIIDSKVAHVDAMELGCALARRWGGFFMGMETPAIAPSRWMRDCLLRRRHLKAVWQRLETADAAIVAVGTPTNSTFANHYVASTTDLRDLKQTGAVGEMCGRFFDASGRECDSPWRDQVISVELEHLRHFPQVIALAVGADRASAVAAAIRGGLVKSLVMDAECARGLEAIS